MKEVIAWNRFPEDTSREEITEKVALQINKDVNSDWLPNDYPTAQHAQWLFDHVSREVTKLLQSDVDTLPQMLYRIDVDEAKVSAAFEQKSTEDTVAILSYLLIEREVEKILYRLSL